MNKYIAVNLNKSTRVISQKDTNRQGDVYRLLLEYGSQVWKNCDTFISLHRLPLAIQKMTPWFQESI